MEGPTPPFRSCNFFFLESRNVLEGEHERGGIRVGLWKAFMEKLSFTRNASEFSSKFYELVYRSDTKLWIKGFNLK